MEKAIETIQVKYKGLNARISAHYDDIPVEDSMDLNPEEMEEFKSKFETGELLNLCILVSVYSKSGHIEGTDSLGACHVHANDALEQIQEIVKEHSMLETAYEEMISSLKQVFNKDKIA